MANRAFALASDLRRAHAHRDNRPLKSPPTSESIAELAGCLEISGVHPAVVDEVRHNLQRRQCGSSDIEWIGAEWRAKHGFGKPFSSGHWGGKGYGRHQRKAAAEAAAKRRAQKASRVRTRIATGMRNIAASAGRLLFRGAARGS